MENFISDVCSV